MPGPEQAPFDQDSPITDPLKGEVPGSAVTPEAQVEPAIPPSEHAPVVPVASPPEVSAPVAPSAPAEMPRPVPPRPAGAPPAPPSSPAASHESGRSAWKTIAALGMGALALLGVKQIGHRNTEQPAHGPSNTALKGPETTMDPLAATGSETSTTEAQAAPATSVSNPEGAVGHSATTVSPHEGATHPDTVVKPPTHETAPAPAEAKNVPLDQLHVKDVVNVSRNEYAIKAGAPMYSNMNEDPATQIQHKGEDWTDPIVLSDQAGNVMFAVEDMNIPEGQAGHNKYIKFDKRYISLREGTGTAPVQDLDIVKGTISSIQNGGINATGVGDYEQPIALVFHPAEQASAAPETVTPPAASPEQ